MKTKKNIIAAIVAVFTMCGFTSCESYLDVDKYIYDMTSLDSIFARKDLLEKYINGASTYMPSFNALWQSGDDPFSLTSDELFLTTKGGASKYVLGEIDRFSGDFNMYSTYYKGIRRANQIIARIHECLDISELDRRDFTGQAYFLRAYFYYCLLRQYGPVPILPDEALPSNGTVDELSFQRGTYDECVKYICDNFETASSMLQDERADIGLYKIATRGAALSLIARIRLEAASPWFNGNKYYYDFLRHTDNVPYISQTKEPQKWGMAAAAAKRVIDMGKYELFTVPKDNDTPELPDNVEDSAFPDGAGDIDPFRSYNDLFTGEEMAYNTSEVIMAASGSSSIESSAFPRIMGGTNTININQKLVNAYRMADGSDINDENSGYPAVDEAWKTIGGGGKTFSGYELRDQAARMYDNREMRFYATIGFCHSYWEASSYTGTTANMKNLEVTYYKDGTGKADSDQPDYMTYTGYTCRKYVHNSDSPKGTYRSKYFPLIRYAEILLSYVEAMNEMEEGTVYTDENGITVSRNLSEMKEYFNMIRFRSGLPGVTDEEVQDYETMKKLIKREWQIEFALEGRRFFDLRRWGDLVNEATGYFYGMNVDAKLANREAYYKETQITWKYSVFNISNKLNFYPFSQTVLDRNAKLDQNPGW